MKLTKLIIANVSSAGGLKGVTFTMSLQAGKY